jgi:adenylate cyclase
MVEDIITGLSRSKSLFVIARHSTFTYKDKAVDIRQVGRELGIRYVLEGSVRRSGTRVRITGQLVDATSGMHLWADRFDSQLDDIFDLQDRMTSSVIGAISPQLERAEIERAKRKPTESLQAYDYYLRALACVHKFTSDANNDALKLTKIANGLDPEFAAAYALGARCYIQRKAFGWRTDTAAQELAEARRAAAEEIAEARRRAAAQEIAEARWLARRAIELDKDDPSVLAWAGHTLAFVVGEVEEGAALVSRAITLDPNLAAARHWSGWAHLYFGDVDAAIKQFEVTLRLSPVDPRIFIAQSGLAYAHFFAGHNADATSWATAALRQHPNFRNAQFILAACHAMSGRIEEAREICARLMQLNPASRISRIQDRTRFRRAEDIDRLAQAFRIAGMPE